MAFFQKIVPNTRSQNIYNPTNLYKTDFPAKFYTAYGRFKFTIIKITNNILFALCFGIVPDGDF